MFGFGGFGVWMLLDLRVLGLGVWGVGFGLFRGLRAWGLRFGRCFNVVIYIGFCGSHWVLWFSLGVLGLGFIVTHAGPICTYKIYIH